MYNINMKEEYLTKDIIKIAKSLKRQFVEITPWYICGTDLPNMNTFSIVYLNESLVGEINPDLYYIGPTTDLTKYDSYILNKYEYFKYKQRMDYLRNVCINFNKQNLLYSIDNCSLDIKEFSDSLNLKSKDGARMITVDDKLFMTCCSAVHPMNKSDIISLEAFEYDSISYLAIFIINKKKYNIIEYIRFLYL